MSASVAELRKMIREATAAITEEEAKLQMLKRHRAVLIKRLSSRRWRRNWETVCESASAKLP